MSIKAYKGFDKNLRCRDFQYEVGKEYETERAALCEAGFHACENPLDVLRFYPLRGGNRYCEVEQDGEIKHGDDKTSATKIKIGAEIGLPGLIKAHFEYTRTKAESGQKVGDFSNLAGGDRSNLAGGNFSNLAGGDRSNLAGGDRSNLAGGNYSNLAGGKSSVCVVRNGKAKGGLNSVLVLTMWKWRDNEYVPSAAKCIIIDGTHYNPDAWYTLKDGKVVEWEGEA